MNMISVLGKVAAQREKQAEGWWDWLNNMTVPGTGDRVAEPAAIRKSMGSGGVRAGIPRSLRQRLQQREAMTRGAESPMQSVGGRRQPWGAMKPGLPRSLQQRRTGSTTPVDGQGLYDRARQQQPAWQQEPLPVHPPTFGPGKGGSYSKPAPLPQMPPSSGGLNDASYFEGLGGAAKGLGIRAAGARPQKAPPAPPANIPNRRWGPS